jgi:hypothetical protein
VSAPVSIEERLAAEEKEVADLKRRVSRPDQSAAWLERIAGTFKDDHDFDEIVRLGREFRQSVP